MAARLFGDRVAVVGMCFRFLFSFVLHLLVSATFNLRGLPFLFLASVCDGSFYGLV